MDLELRGKAALVTGGGRGIGKAIALALAREGMAVAVVGHDAEAGAAAARELGAEAVGIPAELTRTADCQAAVAAALAAFGRLDALVNNAGVNDSVGLERGDPERFAQSLRRNLTHYYEMACFALPALKATRGAILNICSKVAETGQGGTSGYAAACGGRNALVREWAAELAPHGVRANGIVVAECFTPMYAEWLATLPDPAGAKERIEARIPLGHRMTEAAELADAAAFLLSPRASHITGQLLHVDGGYTHLDRALP